MLTTKNIVEVKLRAYQKLAEVSLDAPDVGDINNNTFFFIGSGQSFKPQLSPIFNEKEYKSLQKDFKYYFPKGMFYYLRMNIRAQEHKYVHAESNHVREYIRAFAKHRTQQLQQYLNVIEKCNLKKKSSKRS